MKLKVEIKDDKFIYSYEIGSSNYTSSSPLSAEQLICFSDLIKYCSNISNKNNDEFLNEMTAKIWIEKNKEEAKKILE